MTPVLPKASPTGVRIAGDRYQWLHVWRLCLQVLRDNTHPVTTNNPAIAVGVETDAGNVDDAVLYRKNPPHTYSQVKWTANAKTPLSTDYLTEVKTKDGTSLLAKFAAAHQQLTHDGHPVDMVLRTNRNIDTASVLLTSIDPRTQLLMPHAADQGPTSKRGKERRVWATSAHTTEPELLDLLTVLRFQTGYNLDLLLDNITALMTAAGLRSDANAIASATSWIETEVINGTKRLDVDTISAAVHDLNITAGRAWPTLSIATLKPDPIADQAIYALYWVDRFEGDSPYQRRRPQPPATWTELADDINDLPNHLLGVDAVLVTGSLRLATGFAVGAALRKVTGIEVAWQQGPQLWTSDHPYDQPLAPLIETSHLGQGDHTAIVIDVATTATSDVIEWLKDTQAPIREVLTLKTPHSAPKDTAIPDAATATALAHGMRDTARQAARRSPQLHLFQANPLGLALLLGHRWNRVTTTHVYEDLKTHYELAFTIPA